MVQILEQGLFTRVFTSAAEAGDLVIESVMDVIADDAVAEVRRMLGLTSAPPTGPSAAGIGAPPSRRSGALADSIGRSEVAHGGAFDVNLVSVAIGPRSGFYPYYDPRSGHDAAHYGQLLEKVQGHPFLRPAVRAATSKYAGLRFQQWMNEPSHWLSLL